MNRTLTSRCLVEFAGTAILVGIGTGTMVEGARAGGVPQWALAVAWFSAVTIPVALFASLSGANLNPVVTLAVALDGYLSRREAFAYGVAQLGGAFLASGLVLLTLGPYAHLGSTVPVGGTLVPAASGEFGFTLLLVLVVLALYSRGPGERRWRLVLPGLVVGLATEIIGPWSGSSLNPSRSIAPAVLSGTYTDLWLYLVMAPAAGVLGTIVYPFFETRAPRPRRASRIISR